MTEHIAHRVHAFFAWLRWGKAPGDYFVMLPAGRVALARRRYHFGRGIQDE